MSFDIVKIFSHMGIVTAVIVGVLVVMATASLAVFLERNWAFLRSRQVTRRFAVVARKALDRHDWPHFITEAGNHKASHLAGLLGAGMRVYVGACGKPGELAPLELTRRELQRRADALSAELRRGMGALASVGSVAPFVGLLGTVVGIIDAFRGIAAEGSGGLGAVSAGIAEALVVTALGLVVAIPSVLAFNFLSSQVDGLILAIDQARGEFVDFLENHSPRGKVGAAVAQAPQAEGSAAPVAATFPPEAAHATT
jgi:biopolymer transport protein ExbB